VSIRGAVRELLGLPGQIKELRGAIATVLLEQAWCSVVIVGEQIINDKPRPYYDSRGCWLAPTQSFQAEFEVQRPTVVRFFSREGPCFVKQVLAGIELHFSGQSGCIAAAVAMVPGTKLFVSIQRPPRKSPS
jgi:hypothetical protein